MSMNQPLKTITVFCASSTQVAPLYFDAAERLATLLVLNGIAIKYGGGAVGLMGALANKALSLNGHVMGVIPKFMVEVEWQHPLVENMLITQTMHERKRELTTNVDAVVALPGSSGTLEELIEVISMKKLGLFPMPIIIVNTNGFYDALLTFLERMVHENFMHKTNLSAFVVVSQPEDVLAAVANSPQWTDDVLEKAAI
jgi:uncharacterized protein (TIGR00730 family)